MPWYYYRELNTVLSLALFQLLLCAHLTDCPRVPAQLQATPRDAGLPLAAMGDEAEGTAWALAESEGQVPGTNWMRLTDDDGDVYFYHILTQETQASAPPPLYLATFRKRGFACQGSWLSALQDTWPHARKWACFSSNGQALMHSA